HFAQVVALLGTDQVVDSDLALAIQHRQGQEGMRTQERGEEVEAAQQVGKPVGLQRHDAVESQQGEAQRVQGDINPRQGFDLRVLPVTGFRGAVEPTRPSGVQLTPPVLYPALCQEKIVYTLGAYS